MRFATSLLALLIAAALLSGCDSVRPPKPDPAGDAAFVAQLKALCAKSPALKPVDGSQDAATIIANATANNTVVLAVQQGIVKLTPSLSADTPLVQPITDLAAMLLAVSYRYTTSINAAKANQLKPTDLDVKPVDLYAALIGLRMARARADLAKLGVNTCFA